MIDLLPDCEPATVEAWLRARPAIQIVARDRNDGYSGAVTPCPARSHFRGSLRVVGEWATRQRRAKQTVPAGTGKSPPARWIARLLSMGRDRLSRADAAQVARIEAALPALARGDYRDLAAITPNRLYERELAASVMAMAERPEHAAKFDL